MSHRRLCVYVNCPTPDVPIASNGGRKYHTACGVRRHADRVKARYHGEVSLNPHVQEDESPEAIEAAFQSALGEIKRRPSGEVQTVWQSPLARIV